MFTQEGRAYRGMNATQCLDDLSYPHKVGGVGHQLNWLGVALGCLGSTSINIGNNLQAKGHAEKNGLWAVGTAIFFIASIIQFVAFAFAPASVVAPLESLQFVANLAFAKFVNHQTITGRMLWGTTLILIGTVIAVVSGPIDRAMLIPLETLNNYWIAPGWVVYISCVLVVAAVAELLHRRYVAAAKREAPLCGQAIMLPATFAVSSAMLGTQAVVQAKCAAEVVKLMAAGCLVEVLTNWCAAGRPHASRRGSSYTHTRLESCLHCQHTQTHTQSLAYPRHSPHALAAAPLQVPLCDHRAARVDGDFLGNATESGVLPPAFERMHALVERHAHESMHACM